MAWSVAVTGNDGEAAGKRPLVAYARVLMTAVFTMALVSGEFGLLYGVYHRADPVRHQQVIQARWDGQIQTDYADAVATNGSGTSTPTTTTATTAVGAAQAVGLRAVRESRSAMAELRRAGLSADALRGASGAVALLAQEPTNGARLLAVNQRVGLLGTRLNGHRRELDLEATEIYVGLLVIVSVGWFIWFRRLVQRHRALQQAVTEQQALASSEQRLLSLVQNGSDVVCVLDIDSTASFLSPSSETVLGVPAERLQGSKIVDLVHPDDVNMFVQLLSTQPSGEVRPVKFRITHADGRRLVVEGMLANLVDDPVVGGSVLTFRDVTERQALEERLSYQAFHDSLTGLANRQLFGDRLAHGLQRRPGLAQPLMVLFCDLDDFKNVNDSLGHGAGDLVLEEVGRRILTAIRSGDTAARLGGDEFAILMEATTLEEAEMLAYRLIELIGQPIMIDDKPVTISASVGMAGAVPGEISSEEALRNADVAMYRAKDRGKSTVAAYDSVLHAEALDRLELRGDLQRALRRDELVLHYQPTVELDTGKITGFEALVRWQHPTRGLLSPILFVPMAEEAGLIVQLGTWVLFEACRTAAELQADWRKPTMAVNISSQQLTRPDFVDLVTQALAESGLPADRLTLEITESVVLHDLNDVIPRLTALRERGARVAIDDFGTGYSSLAYLTELPIDVLKVDKSFVDRVAHDEQGASVTEAIIMMSHTMNLTTVAEGVEVAEQAAWLRRVNCPIGQGYFWSRPVDLAGVRELLARPTDEHGGELGVLSSYAAAKFTG